MSAKLAGCTKTLSRFVAARTETQQVVVFGNDCTKTDVYVQIFLDSESAMPHVGRMTHHKLVRVALYSRVSTKDKGQDVRNQTDQLREFCERQNWQIVREYTD